MIGHVGYLKDHAKLADNTQVGANGCIEWTGRRDKKGYGWAYSTKRGNVGAHRLSYLTYVGPITRGFDIDHLCRNPGCVNPAHLEAVTRQENLRRSRVARGLEQDQPAAPALLQEMTK